MSSIIRGVDKRLNFRLFGGFQACRATGEAVAFPNKKAQALIAYLAMNTAHPPSRESLSSLLWGNTGEARVRHNLRQSLSYIRQKLGPIVVTSDDCVSLDGQACGSDVIEFCALAESADVEDLSRCLTLYEGEFLAGLEIREEEFSDWLQTVRVRLRQAACEVATRLAEILIAEGRTAEAEAALKELLCIDSADEAAHRQLIRIYVSDGNRSKALRQFQECERALQRELGATPDAKTRALCLELTQDNDEPIESGADDSARIGSIPTVAVLPFENLSGSDSDYFADGISEDLITSLSSFHSIAVIARGSSFSYRNRSVPEQVIARELGAQYLVSGSVRRLENRVRLNVQLMDARKGLQIWAHRYDRKMDDVFALQDEITSTLVSTLVGRVEAARLSRTRNAAPERLDAYDLVLRGKDHHHRYTAEDTRLCIEMFERAIDRDPGYAVAYAWLACGFGLAIVFRLDDVPSLVDRSQAAAEKGLQLDENESECHRVLAQVQLTRRNLDRALWHQERALALNPNDDRILCAQGEILTMIGRAAEGLEWVQKAMRLNPYHPERYWTHRAHALFQLARYADALKALGNINRLRLDDRVYRVVTNVMLGDAHAVADCVAALYREFPEFDLDGFVESLPHTDPAYRQAVAEPLRQAVDAKSGD